MRALARTTADPGRAMAPIAVTGLKIALQSAAPTFYDTDRCRSVDAAAPAMDKPRAADAHPVGGPAASPQPGLDTTFDLVERVKAGDADALNRLFTRFLPPLRRWASGRLPRWTRDLMDTDDLVQETVLRSVKRIEAFESRHEGALQAYLRQAVVNRIRDEVRRTKRSPLAAELDENQSDGQASPLDEAIGREAVDRYEAALARLRPEEREAVVARIEMDGTYQEVAQALGKPSADAARMAVSRALLRLAEEMNRGEV